MGRLVVIRLDGASSGIYPRLHPIVESKMLEAVKGLVSSALLTARSLGVDSLKLKITVEAEELKLVLSCEGLRCVGLGLAGGEEEGGFGGSVVGEPEGLGNSRVDL